MKRFDRLEDKMDILYPLLDALEDPELITLFKFLADRIRRPESFITFLGETSSGKTSIINSLLGKPLLPMKAGPTTSAITEVITVEDNIYDEFFIINKNASIRKVDQNKAISLIENPNELLSRIRISTRAYNDKFSNMRIFDTPGYDSIFLEHEEILKEFLPNSDIIVYIVNYKIGIQENDYAFLGFMKEMIRDDTEIIVVVNRCPEGVNKNDSKIKEIMQYAGDLLHVMPEFFLIKSVYNENESHPIPDTEELWSYILKTVTSERRIDILYDVFNDYIIELYNKAREKIKLQYTAVKLDEQELFTLVEEQKKTADKIRQAVELYLEPGFNKMTAMIPKWVNIEAENAKSKIVSEIKHSPSLKMQEMQVYIESHLIPFNIKNVAMEVQRNIDMYMQEINGQVDDYLNNEIIKFNSNVSIIISTHTELAAKKIGGGIAHRIGYQSLLRYFTSFGGAGGANAGIANAASHALKSIGSIVGKTFSRETHNALKHFMAKIGATSMKKIAGALTVFIELASVSLDYLTWKKKIIPKTEEAVDNWKTETIPSIISDLDKLKKQNIETIYQIAEDIEKTYDEDVCNKSYSNDIEYLLEMCNDLDNKLGVE